MAEQSSTERYPLHERLRSRGEQAQLVAELYDKLHAEGVYLAEYVISFDDDHLTERLTRASMTGDEFVGLALDIDPKALSAEKDLMLADLRAMIDRVHYRVSVEDDPNRINPDPHWRMYRSPRDERICAICVQNFDYSDYLPERFITAQAFDTEDEAIAAIARLPLSVIDGTMHAHSEADHQPGDDD